MAAKQSKSQSNQQMQITQSPRRHSVETGPYKPTVKRMTIPSSALTALLLAAVAFLNPVAAYPTDEWFELLIDKMCELTAEKGKVGEVGTEAVDYILNRGHATEFTTYAMSVGDQGLGEAIAKGLLATCPDLYP